MLREPGESVVDFVTRALNPFSFRKGKEYADAALTLGTWVVAGALAGVVGGMKGSEESGRKRGAADTSVVDVDFDPKRATYDVDKFASSSVNGVPVHDTAAFWMAGTVVTAAVAALAAGRAFRNARARTRQHLSNVKGDKIDRRLTNAIVDARADAIDKDAGGEVTDKAIERALALGGAVKKRHGVFAGAVANAVVLMTVAGLAAAGVGAVHGYRYIASKDDDRRDLKQLKLMRDKHLADVDTPVRVNLMGLGAADGGGAGDAAAPSVATYERN